MTQCGRCHEDITKTYFETYHGKVSQLGYTKTAKCYDCHGAHDILPVTDPRLAPESSQRGGDLPEVPRGRHPALRRLPDPRDPPRPDKYPVLFWVFWAMTSLLVATFTVGGIHTLLWLPRALKMRREFEQSHRPQTQPSRRASRVCSDSRG